MRRDQLRRLNFVNEHCGCTIVVWRPSFEVQPCQGDTELPVEMGFQPDLFCSRSHPEVLEVLTRMRYTKGTKTRTESQDEGATKGSP